MTMTVSPPALLRITGFTRRSNLVYFLLTACVFAIFCLRHVNWKKPSIPGEEYWYGREEDWGMKVAIHVHLLCVIPAGMLLPLQFLPVMRKKYIGLHRYSGRLLFVLLIVGNITALRLGPKSVGGTIDTQSLIIVVAIGSTISIFKSWSAIRGLRIDLHRVWAMRTWALIGSILTLRIMLYPLIIGILVLSPNQYHVAKSCAEIIFLYPPHFTNSTAFSDLYQRYPLCRGGNAMEETFVAVTVTMNRERPEEMAAMFHATFGAAFWLGLAINMLACEIYLHATRDEDEGLKKVSMSKRKALGLEAKRE
ncbi:hypothetical protein HYALB_00007636 [Hymenoscyphus albidus]|uniref:DUF2306 domain-containing protein n=1 Tax=Hymenoscyphus albidus TaxID=595503 RepID=A0A9N9LGW2_9HELO|nr:hypothetical protein HYALB_00007636 [Hymenoscyphus albidus]